MLENLTKNISEQVGTHLPGILSAVGVLIIGWIVAHIVGRIVRIAFKKTGLGAKLGGMAGGGDISKIAGKVAYYLIMLFVLITFFNVLKLPVVSEPLNKFLSQIFSYAPRVFSAAILGLIGYVLARLGRDFSRKGLEAADIDTKLASFGSDVSSATGAVQGFVQDGLEVGDDEGLDLDLEDEMDFDSVTQAAPVKRATAAPVADDDSVKLSQTLPDAVYWIIIALFLPAILGALQMNGLLVPIQKMFNKAFDYLPNIIGAAVILVIGIFIAKIVKQVASNLAASVGVNKFSEKLGMGASMGGQKISDILGVVVYAMIMLPVVAASLDTLGIDAVTKPASEILGRLTSLIPGFIGAGVVLGIAYFVGKLIADLVEGLLSGVGFDSVPQKIGLNLSNTSEATSPSKLGGKLVMVAIIVLSALQALPMMGLESLAGHVETFAGFGTQVLLGLAIIALGMFVANFVANLVKESGVENAGKLALIAKVAIMVFAGGFGLQQMGLSASIVNVAFGSLLGGLGLAAAIAFGWGGRDAAKRVLDRLVD